MKNLGGELWHEICMKKWKSPPLSANNIDWTLQLHYSDDGAKWRVSGLALHLTGLLLLVRFIHGTYGYFLSKWPPRWSWIRQSFLWLWSFWYLLKLKVHGQMSRMQRAPVAVAKKKTLPRGSPISSQAKANGRRRQCWWASSLKKVEEMQWRATVILSFAKRLMRNGSDMVAEPGLGRIGK